VCAFQTRGAHVFAKGKCFDTDGITLLVVFLCVTDGATFQHQVSKVLIGGVSWAVAPLAEDYFKKTFY
jgi:hypothetical protein